MALKHSFEHISEIGEGLDVIELGRGEERSDNGPAIAAAVRAGEQMVLAAERDEAFIVPLFLKYLETLEVGLPARCDTGDLFAQSRQPRVPVAGRRRGFGRERPAQPARQGGCRP